MSSEFTIHHSAFTIAMWAPIDFEAEVRAHLGAQLTPRAAVEEQRIAVAFAVHRGRHLQHLGRADGNAQEAPFAEFSIDGDGGVHQSLLPAA